MAPGLRLELWEDSCEKMEKSPFLVRRVFGETCQIKVLVPYQSSRDFVMEIVVFCIGNENIFWLNTYIYIHINTYIYTCIHTHIP